MEDSYVEDVEDVVESDDYINLIMEYVKGGTLCSNKFWKIYNKKKGLEPDNRRLDQATLKNLFYQICEGLLKCKPQLK